MSAKAMLAVLTAVCTLHVAEAATVSYSGSVKDVAIINPYGMSEVIVSQFNNSVAGPNGDQLGATLNSVTLVLSGSQYAELLLSHAQGEGETWYVYMVNGTVIFGDGPLVTDMRVGQDVAYGTQVQIPAGPSEMTFIPGTMVAIGTGVETFTSGLEAFQGNGTVSQYVYFSGGWGVMGFTSGDSISYPIYTGAADWSVVYDYTPVPEPSVAMLLVAGGVGMALRRRWQRRVGG
jgi:hypothetical protein